MTLATIMTLLAQGMVFTAEIFLITIVGALPLGVVVALLRMSKCAPVALAARFYISVMRGTPLMLQLMFWMFGPYYIFGIEMLPEWKFTACAIGFIMNYAAYFGEIYRSGIESMPVGQYEAAKVLGYRKSQTFFRIILPQVIKRILPSITNEVITLVKDTSLAFVIGYAELFTLVKRIASREASVLPYVGAAIFYYIFNLVVAVAMEKLEKKMDYYQ